MLKRPLSAFLCLLLILPLAACAEEQKDTSTATFEEFELSETETKDAEPVYAKVDEPLTPERVAAIPVAREGMTTDELRQICVDYVKLSVSFQWISNSDLTYNARQNNTEVNFREGQLWGGLPYINTASGNLYRTLEYYDTETGVLDISTYFKNNLLRFGTACSGTTGWGWARVINSASCKWTKDLNAKNGLIPLGPYTYDLKTTAFGVGGKEDCKDIAHRNGEQVMFESYALSLKADCFVNNGHVRMNGEDPVVVRNSDGTINGEESYVIQVEQGLYTTGAYHKRKNSLGYEYKIQGNDGTKFTFAALYKSGYLPHTFKEFLGTDPIEPAKATITLTKNEVTSNEFAKAKVKANYVISDLFFVFRDENGEVTRNFIYRSANHYSRSASMTTVIPKGTLDEHAKAGHSVEITAQLGNGEKLPVFSGKLLPPA